MGATYCFDALMKDRFVNEIEFAKFPDEFNVAKHLDLGDGTLLLLLRSKRVVMFVIDWNEHKREFVIGRGGRAPKSPVFDPFTKDLYLSSPRASSLSRQADLA